MQRFAVLLAVSGLFAIPAMADEACRTAVTEAFNKQRAQRAFTLVSQLKSDTGKAEIEVAYQPPDRMRQVVRAPGQAPLETTLYGMRAYSRQGEGAWEELMPALAQTIIAQVRQAAVDPPQNVGDFECLGKATVDGREYLAYRSIEQSRPGATQLHRTVYVDPKTGLPALNIVADTVPGSEPVFRGVYDYPEKLEIEDHPDAPLVKMR